MIAALFKHLKNEQGYKFSLITTGISNHIRYLLEEKGVRRWSVFFYLSSKRNQKLKHLVQTKPMGENSITNIMKVSVAGSSLKESEKKVYDLLCKTSEQLWLHSLIDGSIGRTHIASFIFGFLNLKTFLHKSSYDGVSGTDNDEQSLKILASVFHLWLLEAFS